MNNRRIISLLACLFILIQACQNHKWETNIPARKVYFKIDLDYLEEDLKNSFGFVSFPYSKYPNGRNADEAVGYGGLLIFNGINSNGNNQLYAYDLACQVEADSSVLVVPDNDGFARCPKCKATYFVAKGGEPYGGTDVWLHKYNIHKLNETGDRYRVTN